MPSSFYLHLAHVHTMRKYNLKKSYFPSMITKKNLPLYCSVVVTHENTCIATGCEHTTNEPNLGKIQLVTAKNSHHLRPIRSHPLNAF